VTAEPVRRMPATIERVAAASLPTDHGRFRVVAYRAGDGVEHLALVAGRLDAGTAAVLVRVHSECLTGDVLASRRCDCGTQLATALARIDAEARRGGAGVVVYLRGHEGRGIGLANKIRAYQLQEQGLDTVDANTAQGFPADARTYEMAGAVLSELGVTTVRLMTNNPAKATGLEDAGIDVAAVDVGPDADRYLAAKRDRLGHVFPAVR
jgi:3,4-dihydroxy 2-butanone 4-phosphate synthase/GTP cyclohydrolase II